MGNTLKVELVIVRHKHLRRLKKNVFYERKYSDLDLKIICSNLFAFIKINMYNLKILVM